MNQSYDEHAKFYIDFVDRKIAEPDGLWQVLLDAFDELLGDRIRGARVCDIACGEGYLSRHLSRQGAGRVLGVDLSTEMIEAARGRSENTNIDFAVSDARSLERVPDRTFDVAVCQMALMDISDHRQVFGTVYRILDERGAFVFSILHPITCSPFSYPEENQLMFDDNGVPVGCIVRRYASEGFWKSGGQGVRGRFGSYHRTLSTYINDLIGTGFAIDQMREPVLSGTGLAAEVPQVLLIAASKI